MEDVFFSRHVAHRLMPPLEIAQAFAMRNDATTLKAIGSHACWKFLSSADLADHLDQHLRAAWAMAECQSSIELTLQPIDHNRWLNRGHTGMTINQTSVIAKSVVSTG